MVTPTTPPNTNPTSSIKPPKDWGKIGSIATVIGLVLAIIVPTYFYIAQRNNKALSFGVISQGPLVSVRDDLQGRLKITLDGKPMGSVNLVFFKVYNSGNVAIRRSDIDTPVSFNFGDSSPILSAEIVQRSPRDLPEVLQYTPKSIVVTPVLLNPGDAVTIKALVSGRFRT